MPASDANLFTRDDTLFGVCEGLGQELGFHPNWLRVLFGAGVLWSPLAVIAIYCAVGAVLAVTRRLFPSRSAADPAATPVTAPDADNDAAALPLGRAA